MGMGMGLPNGPSPSLDYTIFILLYLIMKIERDDFVMESSRPNCESTHNWFFDLYLNKTIKGKDGNRKELKWEGYGCVVPRCLELISKMRCDEDESLNLEDVYNDLYEEFKELGLRTEPIDWSKRKLN